MSDIKQNNLEQLVEYLLDQQKLSSNGTPLRFFVDGKEKHISSDPIITLSFLYAYHHTEIEKLNRTIKSLIRNFVILASGVILQNIYNLFVG